MEDSDKRPTIRPLGTTESDSVREVRFAEDDNLLGSSLPAVAAEVELTTSDTLLPAEGNPPQRQGPAVAGDKGAEGASSDSHVGSGSGGASGFDADVDETDHTVSVASSVDLVEAQDTVLEALDVGIQRERNTFIWIDKCLERVGSASSDIRKLAASVLFRSGFRDVNVLGSCEDGSTLSGMNSYKQRVQVIKEYLLAADHDFAVQENARMERLNARSEVTGRSSEGMTVSSNKDSVDACGKMKAKSGEDGEAVRAGELEVDVGLTSCTSSEDATAMDEGSAVKSTAENVVNPMTLQQDVTSEDGSNNGGEGERESVAIESSEPSGEGTSDGTSTSSEESEGVPAQQSCPESTTSTSSGSVPEKMRRTEEHHGEEVCKRAQVIRKLVMRQQEALSRIATTAETRVFRVNSACQFLLTCVKCAQCVCSSTLNAYELVLTALRVAEASGAADIVGAIREAADATSQSVEQAIASCERAVEYHNNAVSILDAGTALLGPLQDAEAVGRRTVGDVVRVVEEIQKCVDQRDTKLKKVKKKLSQAESMMGTLSFAVTRVKDANKVTKNLVKRFDDAAFQPPVVAAAYGTIQFTLKAIATAMNALPLLSQLKPGAQTEEPAGQEKPPENVVSVGHGNVPQREAPVDQANDQKNAENSK